MFKKPVSQTGWTQIRLASIPNWSVMLLFAADGFSSQHFQMHFFLGALRVNLLHLTGFLLSAEFLTHLGCRTCGTGFLEHGFQ